VPKLDQLPGRVNWLGPSLGEHTNQILGGLLNLDETEIAELRAERIV
jgi:formyl-CoA transferase